jgi:hypothetical protein
LAKLENLSAHQPKAFVQFVKEKVYSRIRGTTIIYAKESRN